MQNKNKVYTMSHIVTDKKRLIARARRIRGQIEAIEKALESEKDCSEILQTVASCRGALNGLMSELIEGHVLTHVIDPRRKPTSEQVKAADTLLNVVRAYLK
jgi:DNA-binding FrmR family transcriptional regulator